ncbi:hypothetical protein BH23GEM9_BH23GEM9_19740 [soil metagenome]
MGTSRFSGYSDYGGRSGRWQYRAETSAASGISEKESAKDRGAGWKGVDGSDYGRDPPAAGARVSRTASSVRPADW